MLIISVLTDKEFSAGQRRFNISPRPLQSSHYPQEFIIDPYQVFEAKAIGASCILLIGAILNKQQTLELASLANSLGLEVLFEIYKESELELLNSYIQMVGINNRNLKTFKVDIEQSMRLASQLPKGVLAMPKAASAPAQYFELRKAGFRGFLMGEYFMKNEDPAAACGDFCASIREKISSF